MPGNWRSKQATRHQTIAAHAVLAQLREEARLERAMARFEPDDDTTYPPEVDPLSSAQSRRLPVEIHQ